MHVDVISNRRALSIFSRRYHSCIFEFSFQIVHLNLATIFSIESGVSQSVNSDYTPSRLCLLKPGRVEHHLSTSRSAKRRLHDVFRGVGSLAQRRQRGGDGGVVWGSKVIIFQCACLFRPLPHPCCFIIHCIGHPSIYRML